MIRTTMLATAVTLAFGASMTHAAGLQDGVFEGVGQGRNGDVAVNVTIKDQKIAGVAVVKHSETAGISDAALKLMPERIVKAQTVGVDAVTGATLTSQGIKDAVLNALGKAGADPKAFSFVPAKAPVKAAPITETADVVVVGAGGAGISAAVKAESLGSKVILLEKMPEIGGVTQLNAGTLIATGSRYQREVMKETKDSPELAYKDIFRIGKNKNDPELVGMVTHKVGSVVDWLIDDMHIPYGPAATQYPDHSASRQLGVEGRSVNFLKLMKGHFQDMGGKLMLGTRAEELVRDADGRVVGVKARMENGTDVLVKGKSVILASGGFGAVKSMLPKEMSNYVFYGLPSETGDGYKMARKIGAADINMNLVKMYPQGVETVPGHGLAATASSTDTMKKSGAIYVNTEGRRYVDERAGLGVITDATVAQPGHIGYIVMDPAAWKVYVDKSIEDKLVHSEADLMKWTKIVNNGHPVMVVDASLEKAAKAMGIDPKGLAATVADWNKAVAAGKDVAFGRQITGGLDTKGPWTIVEQKVRYQTTLGGLKANKHMQILDVNGKPIPGLYGAGCVVGGANGADSMTAMMNSWAIVSGVVAAENAVENAKAK